jgi:hypothetical protein
VTPEEELELLIEEQRRDDTHIVRPERGYAFSLDAPTPDGDGVLGDCVGVDADGEIVCLLPRRRGDVMGHIPHGTTGGYTNHRCRCRRCRDAHAAYMRAYRPAQPLPASLECAECETAFEPVMPHHLYCSKTCSKRAAWRRYSTRKAVAA